VRLAAATVEGEIKRSPGDRPSMTANTTIAAANAPAVVSVET